MNLPDKLTIANVFIPPLLSCPLTFSASLLPILLRDLLIVGDVNGHNALWLAGASDNRGDTFADEIDSTNFVVLQKEKKSAHPPVFVVFTGYRRRPAQSRAVPIMEYHHNAQF